jgi:peptide chain release factor 2
MQAADFWDNPEQAQKLVKKSNLLKSWTVPYHDLTSSLKNIKEIYPEAEKENDEAFLQEIEQELNKILQKTEELEVKKMLSHEMDNKSCYLSINAGAGGTESCDWVAMLTRMYEKWAQKNEWKVEIVDKLEGEVAGIKSITMLFEGDFAYGYCKSEKGVHRLVRISPFDSNARRHTSFASVDVVPVMDDDITIEIKPDDIRIDTFRSSGAGGQHVNVTDSAVRITHLPTSIVVSCQRERSQLQNKESCMKILKSKLYALKQQEQEESLQKISGEKKEIAWGNQIRSYTFQPYTLVKDTRTKYEEGNIQKVMDGDIEGFVHAYLKEIG